MVEIFTKLQTYYSKSIKDVIISRPEKSELNSESDLFFHIFRALFALDSWVLLTKQNRKNMKIMFPWVNPTIAKSILKRVF